jgi:hypothetical protein
MREPKGCSSFPVEQPFFDSRIQNPNFQETPWLLLLAT